MPLQNYEDLPRRDIEPWCAYFKQLSGVDKTDVFRRIWEGLSDEESDAVIQDLKVFITSGHLATDGIDINIDDDDDVDEDEATNEGENEVKATITD